VLLAQAENIAKLNLTQRFFIYACDDDLPLPGSLHNECHVASLVVVRSFPTNYLKFASSNICNE
jgi:hypothetical protein